MFPTLGHQVWDHHPARGWGMPLPGASSHQLGEPLVQVALEGEVWWKILTWIRRTWEPCFFLGYLGHWYFLKLWNWWKDDVDIFRSVRFEIFWCLMTWNVGSGTSTPLQNNFVTSERLRGGGSSGRKQWWEYWEWWAGDLNCFFSKKIRFDWKLYAIK